MYEYRDKPPHQHEDLSQSALVVTITQPLGMNIYGVSP
jgi:hypothetical protein